MKDFTHSALRYALIGAALAGALAASGGAQAQDIEILANRTNGEGGEMLLTSATCDGLGHIVMTSNSRGGETIQGCGHVLNPGRFRISWDSGQRSILTMDGWEFTPAMIAAMKAQQSAPAARPAVRSEPKPASSFADRILGKDWKCQECLVTTTPSRRNQ
jgi:hypothetical protein